ncbi:uncharacterized protein LOC117169364 [Belonocnema kinseyi]|uniref:uncharacterized protein LOC117169364 n=1 Tax=Belonocnema kinseyi TaxID=2817044 RepID=UPI00143D0E4E|nr:uncharacterized protein LOC117169364 [Belonocnema kinseyi]
MKYLITIQLTLIVFFSMHISSSFSYPRFKPALPKVLKKSFKLSHQKFLEKCEKSKVLDEVENQDYLATQMAYALANVILRKANKLTKIYEKDWVRLVAIQCSESAGVTGLIVDNVAQLNKCFDKKIQMKGWKKLVFTSALLEAYCAAVKKLAKKTYTSSKKQDQNY